MRTGPLRSKLFGVRMEEQRSNRRKSCSSFPPFPLALPLLIRSGTLYPYQVEVGKSTRRCLDREGRARELAQTSNVVVDSRASIEAVHD
jgi:hypothetical protein